jgi:peptidoglycan/xylan/chitin deacetylase (PgdA/CDA1 family)
VRVVLAALAIALAATPAHAKRRHKAMTVKVPLIAPAPSPPKPPLAWPQPAAGPTMSGDPELIFTFDDGPNPKTTPAVLDALKAHHIHAVFFMIGDMAKAKDAQEVIARILREGHIIANHTMSHEDLCRIKDDARAAHEIDDGRATIEKASGFTLGWFRAPYGVRCERVDSMLAERHITHFHWDLDPKEWKHNSAKRAYDYVIKQLSQMTGRQVLLMHDIKKATVVSLPQILDWIDQENAARKLVHKRRIRIIQSYELAEAQLPEGLLDLLWDATPDSTSWARLVASVLP